MKPSEPEQVIDLDAVEVRFDLGNTRTLRSRLEENNKNRSN